MFLFSLKSISLLQIILFEIWLNSISFLATDILHESVNSYVLFNVYM